MITRTPIYAGRIKKVIIRDAATMTTYDLGGIAEDGNSIEAVINNQTLHDGTTKQLSAVVNGTINLLETGSVHLSDGETLTGKGVDIFVIGTKKNFPFYECDFVLGHKNGNAKGTAAFILRFQKIEDKVSDAIGFTSTLLVDKDGLLNEMVWIPAFNWDPTLGFASTTIHPAFVVNGKNIKGFYVGKYQACLVDATGVVQNPVTQRNTDLLITSGGLRASSQKLIEPQVNIDFDRARLACSQMNGNGITGWHLMTNAEWAAIALWSKQNLTTPPRGNNNSNVGDVDDSTVKGTIALNSDGGKRWLTGSGGNATSHNRQSTGIFDINGNIWQWMDGFKLNGGKILVAGNLNTNPTDAGNGYGIVEANYLDTGWYYTWDGVNPIVLSQSGAGAGAGQSNLLFGALTGGGNDTLKKLALAPMTGGAAAYGNDTMYLDNTLERILFRGGSWSSSGGSGIFAISAYSPRVNLSNSIGFRCAFIPDWA